VSGETDRPTTPKADCTHPVATHYHGTHVCYVICCCRCDECKGANSRYESNRKAWCGQFPKTPPPLVDATEVRTHLRTLMDQGMGHKRIAELAGVASSSTGSIIWGRHDRAATKVRRETAEKLLAVELDVSDGAKVDATEAKAIIEELLARGWWKSEIGRRVHGPHALSLQVALTDLVFAGTLRTLRRLQVEPVPNRFHSPTGRWITPRRDHTPQLIEPTTPGVPLTPDLAHIARLLWLKETRRGLAEALELARERDRRNGRLSFGGDRVKLVPV
jgi:hypothetical protein